MSVLLWHWAENSMTGNLETIDDCQQDLFMASVSDYSWAPDFSGQLVRLSALHLAGSSSSSTERFNSASVAPGV